MKQTVCLDLWLPTKLHALRELDGFSLHDAQSCDAASDEAKRTCTCDSCVYIVGTACTVVRKEQQAQEDAV